MRERDREMRWDEGEREMKENYRENDGTTDFGWAPIVGDQEVVKKN